MLQPKPESPYPKLARHWAGSAAPVDLELVDTTREALASVAPSDLAGVGPLVAALLGHIDGPLRSPARRALFALLDGVRRRRFVAALRPDGVEPWLRVLLPIVRRADYTLGDVLGSREETDPKTIAMRVLGAEAGDVTVADLARRTRAIARGLLALADGDPEAKVAILSENALEAALCDLACLTNGIVNFPLPANATAEQVVYMLRHSGARILLAGGDAQVGKVLPSVAALPELKDIVVFSAAAAERNGLLSLGQMIGLGAEFDDAARAARGARVRSSDVATVMYTSGTTGRPKGIVFTHENIVSKRLCRGFALRALGEGDVFLCYLPLYHTFGRWLEMTGTLWWGATYVFARSTAQASLLEDFRTVKPTAFISVPKKWIEIREAATADLGRDDDRSAASLRPRSSFDRLRMSGDGDDDAAAHLRAICGGRLRTGLSAAGYLDPQVFRAFHRAGVDLCSGYGMTEATGGITMTAPGEYVEGSVGTPLPGIECRRADDGELLIRGPYVSPGYWRPEPEDRGPDADGWFATGDLVAVDAHGQHRITGRKKEIYKNRQGQTIAPQRIEGLLRGVDGVAQAFLAGDHREYNTLLVWPDHASPRVKRRSAEERHELLSSIVADANRLLAPYERLVAFEVLPRALDEAHGELAPDGTFRREVIERNWKELVDRMYERKHLALDVGGMSLRVPNWVLREIGVLQHEVHLELGRVRASARQLAVGPDPAAPGSMRVGDLSYTTDGGVLDLGALLARPSEWVGNDALRSFLGDEAFASLAARRGKGGAGAVRLDVRAWPPPRPSRLRLLLDAVAGRDASLESIHAAGELLRAERPEARHAIAHLHAALGAAHGERAALCRALLRRAADAPDEEVRRDAFRALVPHEKPAATISTLALFFDRLAPLALRDDAIADLGERGLGDAQLRVLLTYLSAAGADPAPVDASARRLLLGAMRLVTACAVARPVHFAAVRVPLARLTLHDDADIAAGAAEELDRLRRGFSEWIGPNLPVAIDPRTGAEYGWRDVLVFDATVPEPARDHLLQAIATTTIVRASVFLLYDGVLLSLADLPPGGGEVSFLGRRHGKSVYRLSLHTRAHEVFDVAINVAEELSPVALRQEVSWLLAAGAAPPVVERFGGTFAEWGMFTEEFIPGDTVERQIARLAQQGDANRLRFLWPFLVWSALERHVRFWDRTGQRLAVHEPSPSVFIVPSHDYQSGARIVSISDRSACTTLEAVLDRFEAAFVAPIVDAHPELAEESDPFLHLSAAVEALGIDRARFLLQQASPSSRRAVVIPTFLERLREGGFTPQRVRFASRRYHRWLQVNAAPTVDARGTMLTELWATYRLDEVESEWPDTRIRFFRATVFAAARAALAAALDRLMARARALPPGALDLEEQVAAIRSALAPTPEEDYFLARMTYPWLTPTDDAALVATPPGHRSTLEVAVTVADGAGRRYTVRDAISPREVVRLLHMFHESNLQVNFTSEHEFLLALDASETVIAGLFYRTVSPDRVHLEKLVVGRDHRGRGVSDGLVRELARRLRARGVRTVETGYFQPDYLGRLGFRTDPTSGGLVRELEADPSGT